MSVPPHVLSRRALLGALAGLSAGAARPSRAAGPPKAPRLRRGVSFHHVLNWPEVVGQGEALGYAWPPFADAGHRLAAADLERVKALGFDFVRLTVDPGIFIAEAGERAAELERRLRDAVAAILGYGLSVVVDLHPVRANPAYSAERLTAPGADAAMQAYAEMSSRVAAALRSAPGDRVALELFNEAPLSSRADVARWPALLRRLHEGARRAAPDLALILAGAQWDDRTTLMRLDLAPYRDGAALFTFHYYDPHLFTHQGVEGDVSAYVDGLDWPIDPAQAQATLTRARLAIDGDLRLDADARRALGEAAGRQFRDLLSQRHDNARIAQDFREVGAWADANAIPRDRILLGEFGCVRQARGRPLGPARLAWIGSVRRAAEAEGFAWAYWAYKGYGGMDLVDAAGRLHADLIEPLGLAG